MDIGLMVEGQFSLTWERWSHILAMAERLGFPTVFRSDHVFIGKQRESLDAFLSFVVAAQETTRIRFGPLCTSFTAHTPMDVARMSAQLDLLSGGRFALGLGVGWYEPEFRAYGVPFPPMPERFERLEEGINVLHGMWSDGPVTYAGHHYSLEDADSLPKPSSGRPPIVIGGTGERKTLRLVAQYADEWNCDGYLTAERYAHKVQVLEQHCEAVGRDPAEIRRSMLVHVVTGPDEKVIDRIMGLSADLMNAPEWADTREARQAAEADGMVFGSAEEVAERLAPLAELGVHEVQIEHLDFASDEVPEYLASELVPIVADL